eukprot:12836872-Heterocapsa_arctica.AAC.1
MWLLPERADLNFAVKELARSVQKPCERHWTDLKRVLRYLRGTMGMVMHLNVDPQEKKDESLATTDASWASNR